VAKGAGGGAGVGSAAAGRWYDETHGVNVKVKEKWEQDIIT